ncbi:hypothetical protein ACFV06_01930 [Streptomyces sp. NPDC059618]|uniref:hypothetical protein n=1 Tax=Streptomyces sp. NPDC059618 TaxID=3346887 RepID=UPI0036C24A39
MRRFGTSVLTAGMALLATGVTAPTAWATAPAPVVIKIPTTVVRHYLSDVNGAPYGVPAAATTLHVALPADIRNLPGLAYGWEADMGEVPVRTPIAPGTAAIDVPAPSFADNPYRSYRLDVFSDMSWSGAPMYVPTQTGANLSATFFRSTTAGPSVIPVDLAVGEKVTDQFTSAAAVSVPAGGIVELVGAKGQFLGGPDGSWSSPGAPEGYFFPAGGGNDLRPAVSADGSTLTVRLPSVLPLSEDPGQEYLQIRQSAAGSPVSQSVSALVRITGAGHAAIALTRPTVTGTPAVGSVLTAHAGTWYPTPQSYQIGYQWLRDGKNIALATRSTYKLTAADAGHILAVRVTTSPYGYAAGSAVSTGTHSVTGLTAPKATTAPTITGTARVGAVLTAHRGVWKPAPTSYRYQWYRAGKPIPGATKTTYKPVAADRGKKITLRVTVGLYGHTNGTALSKALTIR